LARHYLRTDRARTDPHHLVLKRKESR
jgi:hypothetical protein